MTRALVSGLDVAPHRDALDLDLRPAQKGSADRRARRLVRTEPLRVDLVHRLEILEVREEYGRLGHAVERRVRGNEDGGEVVEDAPRLCAHVVAAHELAVLCVERELPRAEDKIACDDRLAIWADGRGRAVRSGGAKVHLLPLSRARRRRRA